MAQHQPDLAAWRALLLDGDDDPLAPRVAPVPVRLPLPPATHQGSIYENQRALGRSWFGAAPAAPAATREERVPVGAT